jgi:hypothetical protein
MRFPHLTCKFSRHAYINIYYTYGLVNPSFLFFDSTSALLGLILAPAGGGWEPVTGAVLPVWERFRWKKSPTRGNTEINTVNILFPG